MVPHVDNPAGAAAPPARADRSRRRAPTGNADRSVKTLEAGDTTIAAPPGRAGGSTRPVPRLSVVVVAFNSAGTLGALWESLRPELAAVGPAELFLVDNASADGSIACLE